MCYREVPGDSEPSKKTSEVPFLIWHHCYRRVLFQYECMVFRCVKMLIIVCFCFLFIFCKSSMTEAMFSNCTHVWPHLITQAGIWLKYCWLGCNNTLRFGQLDIYGKLVIFNEPNLRSHIIFKWHTISISQCTSSNRFLVSFSFLLF